MDILGDRLLTFHLERRHPQQARRVPHGHGKLHGSSERQGFLGGLTVLPRWMAIALLTPAGEGMMRTRYYYDVALYYPSGLIRVDYRSQAQRSRQPAQGRSGKRTGSRRLRGPHPLTIVQ